MKAEKACQNLAAEASGDELTELAMQQLEILGGDKELSEEELASVSGGRFGTFDEPVLGVNVPPYSNGHRPTDERRSYWRAH